MAKGFGQGFQIVIDPAEWARFKKAADEFDKRIIRTMRKRIRKAGSIGVEAVRSELRKPPPSGGTNERQVNARSALIKGTSLRMSFAAKSAGVRITTSSKYLPVSNKGFLRAYNLEEFRHPVFGIGGTTDYIVQDGRPYFGHAITKKAHKAIAAEMRGALKDAAKAMGGIAK